MTRARKYHLLIILLLTSLVIGGLCYFLMNRERPLKTFFTQSKAQDVWMNVFIHGSFKVFLGFLSLSQVVNDNINDTPYKKITKKLRKDDFFFRGQTMLQKGLLRITPSFDLAVTENKKLAAFPITQAYRVIQEQTTTEQHQELYYTFGWSGLISQQHRRKESIRLYNAIQEEITALRKEGFNPHLRLITHSHAGNLSLNLAAINKLLTHKAFLGMPITSEHVDEQASLDKMFTELKALPPRQETLQKKSQRKFDYVPEKFPLIIDELILFGTPIQPETEQFFLADTFKHIYHFYSEEDVAQQLDWVSTRNYLSGQRISDATLQKASQQKNAPRIIQARIMYDRPYKTEVKNQDGTPLTTTFIDNITQAASSFLSKMLKYKATKDPNHKDLWCFAWDEESENNNSSLSPLPTVIITPLLISMLKKLKPDYTDLDINITTTKEHIITHITTHNNKEVIQEQQLPINIINDIKERVKPWQTDRASQAAEFEAIYRHINS